MDMSIYWSTFPMKRVGGLFIFLFFLTPLAIGQSDNLYVKEYADPIFTWGDEIAKPIPYANTESQKINIQKSNPLGTTEGMLTTTKNSKTLGIPFKGSGAYFTFSFWIYFQTKQENAIIFSAKEQRTRNNLFEIKFNAQTAGIDFVSKYFSGAKTASLDLQAGQWHHIAISYAPGVMKFYKDGMIMVEQNVTGALAMQDISLVYGSSSTKMKSFVSSLTSVKIYDYVLNEASIRDLFNQKLTRWNLTEGEGTNTFEVNGHAGYEKWEGSSWRSDIVFRKKTLEMPGIHGKIKGAKWEKDEWMGNALHFSENNDYVEAYPVQQISLANQFTITCFVKRKGNNSTENIILAREDKDIPSANFKISLDKDNHLVFLASGNTFRSTKVVLNSFDQWNHLAIRKQGSELEIFNNGLLIEKIKCESYIASSATPLFIGGIPGKAHSFNGAISKVTIFGKALDKGPILDILNEIAGSYWKMDEKDTYLVKDNLGIKEGVVAKALTVYAERSPFGFVKKITEPTAYIQLPENNGVYNNRFSLALWVKLDQDVKQKRVIVAKGKKEEAGSYSIYLKEETGSLFFRNQNLPNDINAGIYIKDTLWHHLLISYDGAHLRFYLDRSLQKIEKANGVTIESKLPLTIGNSINMSFPLKGSVAHVKSYHAVLTPEEATTVVPPANGPYLKLNRGIALDRIQRSFPLKPEMEISSLDMKVVRYMGFDHVKVLFTANSYINENGLNGTNMGYVQKMVDTALTSGLPVLICLHPEPDFKFKHLGNEKEFIKMLGFYEAFTKYISERWTKDQVAFQLMTEPHGPAYGPEFKSWNLVYRDMLTTTRKNLKEHTIVIPGNRVGNLYGMTSMIPVEDKNVYYSFTTHEPFQFSQNARFGDYMGAGTHWRDISYIPWPSSPEIVRERLGRMIKDVKPEEQEQAKNDLLAYGDAHYNRQWINMRINHINNWNDSYGGNLAVMVVEFGALDPIWVRKFGKSKGVYPIELAQYIKDLREALESAGIGWTFWGFNEASAVLNPVSRMPYAPAVKQDVSNELMDALGLFLRN